MTHKTSRQQNPKPQKNHNLLAKNFLSSKELDAYYFSFIKLKIINPAAIQIDESATLKDGHLKLFIPKSKKSTTPPLKTLSITFPKPPLSTRQKAYFCKADILCLFLQSQTIIADRKIKTKTIKKIFIFWNELKAMPVL
jgi:hypothetical protein